MTRKPPIEAPELAFKPPTTITEVRTYEIITPLFGGGVEPGQADPISVVRAGEVRGQLRFWWRATRGGQFDGNLARMREAEEALWGGAARFDERGKPLTGQSLVQVLVELENRGYPLIPEHNQQTKLFYRTDNGAYQPVGARFDDPELARKINGLCFYEAFNRQTQRNEYRPLYVGSPESKDGYLAFPLRSADGRPGGVVYEGVRFRVTLSYPCSDSVRAKAIADRFPEKKDIEHEVAAALWAWETFGGIGARTRRGFGALALLTWMRDGQLQTIQRPASGSELHQWITAALQYYVAPGSFPDDVPHLTQTLAFKGASQQSTGKAVWRDLGQKLKNFRQRRRQGYQRPGQKPSKFGRSRWPEPDAVRHLAGTSYEEKNNPNHNHHTPIHTPRINAFPRAAFGLPISFEFQREQTNPSRSKSIDPAGKNTLEGDDRAHERLASPLILRSVLCADNKFTGLAAILEGSRLPPMQITVQHGRFSHTQKGLTADLTPAEAQALGNEAGIESLRGVSTTVFPRDILLAFLKIL